MQRLPLKANKKGFSICDLEENVQEVVPDFFGVVENRAVHLLAGSKRASFRFDMEDLLINDVLLECLFLGGLSWISPGLHLYLRVVRHFEQPVSLNATNVLDCQNDFPGLGAISNWHFSEVPGEFS